MQHHTNRRGLLALIGFAAVPGAFAGGGIGGGFSTEITQLANKVELVSTAASTAKTVVNTLQTVTRLQQQLRSMDPALLGQMMGLDVEQVSALSNLQATVSDLQSSYMQTQQVLSGFRDLSMAMNMKPSDLLSFFARAAQQKGDVYKSAFDADKAILEGTAAKAQALNKQMQATQALAKDENIAGNLNNLAVINQRASASLIDISSSIARANALAAQEKMDQANAMQSLNNNQKEAYERYIANRAAVKVDGALPDPGTLLKSGTTGG